MPTPARPIDRLIGVYHSDGGVRGELAYIASKVRGGSPCSLCDITHGYTISGRRSFKTLSATSPVPFRMVHRNEQAPDLATITQGTTPCVVAEVGTERIIVLGPADLGACKGDVSCFSQTLDEGLARLHLRYPDGGSGG